VERRAIDVERKEIDVEDSVMEWRTLRRGSTGHTTDLIMDPTTVLITDLSPDPTTVPTTDRTTDPTTDLDISNMDLTMDLTMDTADTTDLTMDHIMDRDISNMFLTTDRTALAETGSPAKKSLASKSVAE